MHMIEEQPSFLMPLGTLLDPRNRWVLLGSLVPWNIANESYEKHFSEGGGPTPLPVRVALGALIIKERLGLTDREVVEQIRENPYLQYFLGRHHFSYEPLFDASMMTTFRKRIPMSVMQAVNDALIQTAIHGDLPQDDDDTDSGIESPSETQALDEESEKLGDSSSPESRPPSGSLLIDATCAPADITFPTDLKLMNHARELTEKIIDTLHKPFIGKQAKPRTYRKQARRSFLNAIKSKRASKGKRRTARGKQVRFLRRNLAYIAKYVEEDAQCLCLLDRVLYRKLLIIQELYRQQLYLYTYTSTRTKDRIVNIAQPHIRPIVRGKAHAPTEFGAKISASIVNGFASLDRLSWDAYNECQDLPAQAELFKQKTGHYPEVILADKIYRTRSNRKWCKTHHIRLSGMPPGRPSRDPIEIKALRRQIRDDEAARQPIEGAFGCGKRRYGLNKIMCKLAETSATAIALTFLVMNLEKLLVSLWCYFYRGICSLIHTVIMWIQPLAGAYSQNIEASWCQKSLAGI